MASYESHSLSIRIDFYLILALGSRNGLSYHVVNGHKVIGDNNNTNNNNNNNNNSCWKAEGEKMTQRTFGHGSLLWCNVGITSAGAKAFHLNNNNNDGYDHSVWPCCRGQKT